MRYCSIIALLLFISCKDHSTEIDNAIESLEWIDNRLDEIGERNIPNYKYSVYIPGLNDDEHNDSIIMSEQEFREIQDDLYSVIEQLEQLSSDISKEFETE